MDAGREVDSGPPPEDAGPRDAGPDAGPPDAGPACTGDGFPSLSTERAVPGHSFTGALFVTFAPGSDDLFVVEQPGRIQRVRDGAVSTFLDIRSRTRSGGERGLLGLAFHPDYDTNGRFFVYYTPMSPDTNRVAEYGRSSGDPLVADDTEVAVLVDIDDPESNHNGGMVAFGPDGFLYAGTGDGGGGGDNHGTIGFGLDTTTLMGKILRLDVDAAGSGYAAAGNPFASGGGLPQIWAYGLRNPWRFSFDRLTGDLYIADVGQSAWEEVNVQPASSTGGENYGWRAYEGFEVFRPDDVDEVDVHAEPVAAFSHSGSEIGAACSITGGYVYRGGAIPALQGWYLFGDFCTGRRAAFRMCDGEMVGLQEVPDLRDVGGNLRSWGEGPDGEIYIVGNNVFRIIAGE